MKKIILLFCLIVMVHWAAAQNTCATALPINGPGLYVVDAVNGPEVASPICADNGTGATMSEWYLYTASQNYAVTISTDLTVNIGKDTRVHVYTGTCAARVCLAGDDDAGSLGTGYLSVVTFNAVAGNSYYIAFDNKWNASGFTFNLTEGPYSVPVISFNSTTIPTVNSSYDICVVDMNGDYRDDLVGVNNNNIVVHLQLETGGFTPITIPTPTANQMPSWSMAAADYNKDGYNDLMYGSGSGITFLRTDNSPTSFTEFSPSQYVFCQRTNFVDLNNDGNLDAFSCHDVDPNVYFLNDGAANLTFYQSNITPGAMQLGIHPEGGNYGSIFVDYDNDGDQDLFIAKCRGGSGNAKINELHRNNGDGSFTDVSVASNMADPVQTWSSAWGDFDNDGDMDAVIGASSTADGTHKYMRNNGDGTFTNATTGSGWDTFTSYNIEHIAHDFNNDGFIDVMGGGNKIMFNQGNGVFSPTTVGFGVGAVGDLNNDGFLDIQNGNVIRYNSGNSYNWIKFHLQGIQSNSNGIGARIEIHGPWGIQIRDLRSGDGFRYMSSLNVHFGIGAATGITQAIIRWPSGTVDTILNPTINQPLLVVEGSTLAITDNSQMKFTMFPNPAGDFINFSFDDAHAPMASAVIYDLTGKTAMPTAPLVQSSLDVRKLSTGTYIVLLTDVDGKTYSHKFIKK